jgi:hypothetical protein
LSALEHPIRYEIEKPPPCKTAKVRLLAEDQFNESTIFYAVTIGGLAERAREGRGWRRERKQHQEVIEQGFGRLIADVLAKGGAPRSSFRYRVAFHGSPSPSDRHRSKFASTHVCI